MTIGQIEFTSTKYHTGASTAKVTLDWDDDKIQIFRGSGVKTIELPTAKESNSYGEIWIVNDQTAANNLTVDGDATNRVTTTGEDVTISQNKAAHFRYVPQRVKYDQYGKSVPAGSWVPIASA